MTCALCKREFVPAPPYTKQTRVPYGSGRWYEYDGRNYCNPICLWRHRAIWLI